MVKAVDNSNLWQAVLGDLEVTESKANFKTWLKPTQLLSLQNEVALIRVPNVFFMARLQTSYKPRMVESLQKHGAEIQDVQFTVESTIPSTTKPKSTVAKLEDAPPDTNDHEEEGDDTVDAVALEKARSTTQPAQKTTIISHHTFDTFVVGNNNMLAYNVSIAVAQKPGQLHNPLFVYGGVGLGKTHLMHALANEIVRNDPKKKVRYVSCETFTNDYIAAISAKRMDEFKKAYRSVDLLCIDDIQFISNKEGSQEEFFNTFNTLHQSNRQIVIAADRPPKAIPGIEERLASRLGWGMVVDIQSPNLETRLAILQSKCAERNIDLPQNALEYIATQVQSNIRDLEGALNRAITYAQMMHVPFSLESTRNSLTGVITPTHSRKHSPDVILRLIAEYFGISLEDLTSKKRTKDLVYPRQLAMYVMREDLGMSYPNIAKEIGGKDHTTIMHGFKKIKDEVVANSHMQHDYSNLKERLASL